MISYGWNMLKVSFIDIGENGDEIIECKLFL